MQEIETYNIEPRVEIKEKTKKKNDSCECCKKFTTELINGLCVNCYQYITNYKKELMDHGEKGLII